MPNLGPTELIVIGVIVVLLFGTRKLPELGQGLGKAIANFRQSFREGNEEAKKEIDSDKTPKV